MIKVLDGMSDLNDMPSRLVAERNSFEILIFVVLPSQKLLKELVVNNIGE